MNLLEALLYRGLATDAHEARGLILAGKVLVNDVPASKPGHKVKTTDTLRVRGVRRYASRAGEKLAAALAAFHFPVAGRTFLDIGAATGGFTDVLLQNGAAFVIAVDVGRGLLHQKLRTDARVQVIEDCDFRMLESQKLHTPPEAFVADVSFISLAAIVKKAFSLLVPLHRLREGIVLFKPQFELPRSERDKLQKGILTDEDRAVRLIDEFAESMVQWGITVSGRMASPIKGTKGNQEYLLHLVSQTAFTQ